MAILASTSVVKVPWRSALPIRRRVDCRPKPRRPGVSSEPAWRFVGEALSRIESGYAVALDGADMHAHIASGFIRLNEPGASIVEPAHGSLRHLTTSRRASKGAAIAQLFRLLEIWNKP
jgi:hypothetical protein